MPQASRYQLCCGFCPIFTGVFCIAFHSFVHGIYGTCLILTTYYKTSNDIINYLTLTGYILLIIIGIPILCVTTLQHHTGIKCMGAAVILLTTYNLCCSCLYFVEYFWFKANSLLDKGLLWRHDYLWVTQEGHPFTIWHWLACFPIIVTPVWFYYAYVLFLFISYLRVLEEDIPEIPEIIVMDNRMSPFGYQVPQGYPYSTNQPPGYPYTTGQPPSYEVQGAEHPMRLYQPRLQQRQQESNNPTTVLD